MTRPRLITRLRSWRLARLVATAAGAGAADVAEQYSMTAFVVQRPPVGGDIDRQTVVVELVRDRDLPGHRWCALAADELRGWWTPLSHGNTAREAIAGIAWGQLDLCRAISLDDPVRH
jgi:hypothetical protein